MTEESPKLSLIELATELTIAWLANPNTRATVIEVPEFLKAMHQAVQALGQGPAHGSLEDETSKYTPAVTARRSLASPDHIISLIDGKPYKTLRRHLSGHGLTPEQYRQRYGLKSDYPMVAPAYSETRRSMAHKIGLGQKGRKSQSADIKTQKAKPARARSGRKPGPKLAE